MQVYRIAKEAYIRDLTGIGAKTVGGRWNRKGVALLYTSSTVSLSTLEVLAHLPPAYFPDDMSLATIEIPEDEIITFDIDKLPKGWNMTPPPIQMQEITNSWIDKNESLGLRVPSIIIPSEVNILINPLHHRFNKIKLSKVIPFTFDKRLLK